MNDANKIVDRLLEAEQHDDHMRPYERVQKWAGAKSTFADLQRLRAQANKLHGEMGQAISYEHALAQMGVQRSDVASPIYGAQVSATDNYKRETPVKMCKNTHCSLAHRPQPDSVDECPDCQEPLQTVMKRTPPMDLRNKLAQHIVGVETKDGRRVWFQEPVPPRHHNWGGSDEEKKPVRPPNDAEKRLGKWW